MESSVKDLATRRKTARKFSSKPVDLKDILRALEAACQAPSGANSQPWRFLIITDQHKKRRIREACEEGERKFHFKLEGGFKDWLDERNIHWRKPFLEEAPTLLIVFSDRQAPYSTESVWLAIGYILLVLEEAGLSTITYTPSYVDSVLKEIDPPEGLKLEVILPIGLPEDEKLKESRMNLDEVTFLNTWEERLCHEG